MVLIFFIRERHICHILFQKRVKYIINIDIPIPPPQNVNAAATKNKIKNLYEKHLDDDKTARDILFAFMEPDI